MEQYFQEMYELMDDQDLYVDNSILHDFLDDTTWTDLLGTQAFNIAMTVTCILFGILVVIVCQGIVLYTYVMKSAALFMAQCLILSQMVVYYSKKEELMIIDKNEEDMVDEEIGALRILESVRKVFLAFEESLTFMLIYEVYLCTKEMAVRQLSLKKVFGQAAAVFLLDLALSTIDHMIHLADSSTLVNALRNLSPALTLYSLIGMVYSIYCSSHILLELRKSRAFHDDNQARSRNKNWHIIGLIITANLALLLRLGVRVASAALITLNMDHVIDCRESWESWENESNLEKFKPCLEEFSMGETISVYLSNTVCGLLELFGILCILTVKKFRSE